MFPFPGSGKRLRRFVTGLEVRVGIEEELFLVDEAGRLVKVADDVMKTAAEMLDTNRRLLDTCWDYILGLDPEPNPAQIEYMTLPLDPARAAEACRVGRHLIKAAAEELGYKVLLESMHPFESDPLPINGTHINVMVKHAHQPYMKPEQMLVVYNWLWYNLPLIIAATANSPYCCKGKRVAASSRLARSRVLKPNYRATIRPLEKKPALTRTQYYGRLRYKLRLRRDTEFEERVVAHPDGRRLVDITPRGPASNVTGDENESPTRNRVEVRAIDNQKSWRYLHDTIMLNVGLAIEALYMYEEKDKEPPNDPHHFENRNEAIKKGIKAKFIYSDEKVRAKDMLKETIERISQFLDPLGIQFLSPMEKGKVELENRPRISVEYADKQVIKLIGSYVKVVLGSSKKIEMNGRKYEIPKGATIVGKLVPITTYEYRESTNGFILDITKIKIRVGIKRYKVVIPLDEDDQIVRVLTEAEYLLHAMRGL